MKVESRQISFKSLNTEISFNNSSIIINFLHDGLGTLPEGSMSQNFDLGSRYYFMLCRMILFHSFLHFID